MRKQIAASPPWIATAVATKVADRLANVEASQAVGAKPKSLLTMYRNEHEKFRELLFIDGVSDSMWSALDRAFSANASGRKKAETETEN